MARCQCSGSSSACGCDVRGGNGIKVSGTGSANTPFIVDGSPNFYDMGEFNTVSPPLYINRDPETLVGSHAVFLIDGADGSDIDIYLPDGSINAPLPALGSVIDIFVRGSLGANPFTLNWMGGVKTWFAPGPTTTPVGWYQFVFTGQTFMGRYLPLR